MKKYTTVLFDLDGTLTDPGEGIVNSVAYALNKYGIEVEDKKITIQIYRSAASCIIFHLLRL